MRLFLFLLLLPAFGIAQVKKSLDKNKSSITYYMKHLLHAWDGTSKELNGVVLSGADSKIEKVAIATKVSSFDSENSNRDAHLLEVVEALKYPTISFYSTSITEPVKGELEVKGILQFHGVSKEISFKAYVTQQKSNIQVVGDFIFLLEDFKIERPSFMLKPVNNEVKVKFYILF